MPRNLVDAREHDFNVALSETCKRMQFIASVGSDGMISCFWGRRGSGFPVVKGQLSLLVMIAMGRERKGTIQINVEVVYI